MTDEQQQIESLNSEVQVLQKKLDSKSKAFAILINELDALKHERNQFKSLADSLQEKCVQLKKQAARKIEPLNAIYPSQAIYEHPNDTEYHSLSEKESTISLLKTALKTVQDEKEALQMKIDELTRDLTDTKGDLLIFRQTRHRIRSDEHPSENDDQTVLLERLEQSNERITELENEWKSLVCQKEELEIERDSFKAKYNKVNAMLSGNEHSLVDVDLVLSENRYLKEKLTEVTREKDLATANSTKYKDLLQSHRSGKIQSGGNVLTYKQVRSLINQSYVLPETPETDKDLRAIAVALFDSLKDKNVTIVHQRKINKILASRVAELEKRLAEYKLTSKSEQASSLIDLLDRTPSPDGSISQFVNSTDNLPQLSSTQIFSFSSTTSSSPVPLSTRLSDHDSTGNQTRMTRPIATTTKSRYQSESTDLEMDDPLQSPRPTSAVAYLNRDDLIPPSTSDSNSTPSSKDDTDSDQDLLRKTRLSAPSTTVTNLTC